MSEIYYALNPWWEGKDFPVGISRPRYIDELSPKMKRRQIEVLTGSRRAGKTTILKQLIKQALKDGVGADAILYLALDHPQLAGRTVSEHLKYFRKLFKHSRNKKLLLFLDEVQESPNWQTELKAVYDLEEVKMVCTGSTASLIQGQGGKLTGRQIITTVYPLDFEEFLVFKGGPPSRAEEYQYVALVEDYLRIGGYPENVLNPSEEYLSNLLDDILARDIIRLHDIRKAGLLKDLFRLITASVGSRISYNKLANTLGVALETVRDYIGLFESAFLVKTLGKWTTSHTDKVYANKKLFLVDTGLKTLITGPGDLGAKAENAVFIKFGKEKIDCGYFAHSEKEVDFVIGPDKVIPIEVKYDSALEISDRRLAGLRMFLRQNPRIDRAIIVTKDFRSELRRDGVKISFIPLWEFLCQRFRG